MNNVLFKDLAVGSPIYALVKYDDDMRYIEGCIVSLGQQRVEQQAQQSQGSFPIPTIPCTKTVIDVTYTLDGKNYTDAVDVTSYMFATEKAGGVGLIATDKEPVLRELNATLKRSEDFLKSTETEIPRKKKRVEQCKTLICSLDTAQAEKRELEKRIKKLEDSGDKTNKLLNEILSKLK